MDTKRIRAGKILDALPKIFTLQPSSDYQALVSHSASELTAKAWARTGQQMRAAMQRIEDLSRRA